MVLSQAVSTVAAYPTLRFSQPSGAGCALAANPELRWYSWPLQPVPVGPSPTCTHLQDFPVYSRSGATRDVAQIYKPPGLLLPLTFLL